MRYFSLICGFIGMFTCFIGCMQGQVDLVSEIQFAEKMLLKNETLQDYYEINDEGISMYSSPEAKRNHEPECRIGKDEFETFLRLVQSLPADSMLKLYQAKGNKSWDDSILTDIPSLQAKVIYKDSLEKPLLEVKLAIDPGHIAGDFEMAEIEGKYMKMHPSPQTDMKPIEFFEANLALGTAHIIRERLEEMGAEVLMTRTQPNTGALGLEFNDWKRIWFDQLLQEEIIEKEWNEKQVTWWKTEADDKDIFSYFFNSQDLKERARLINEFRPHLTLIIHYNVDSPNWDKRDEEGYFTPTGQNYCMAFVPGSFMKGELDKPEARVEFLRLLISDEIKESIKLSDAFVQKSTQITGVPIVKPDYPLGYLHRASILAEKPGVYARNLTLTRLIKGPLCYGESLCQDNIVECLALNQNDAQIAGFMVSKRVKDVADAYVEAVLEYLMQ